MLHRDFKELLSTFAVHHVEYIVVGGYAVAHHGHPRYTNDLDIFVNHGKANAARLVAAFVDFGFPNTFSPKDFLQPNNYYAIGEEPVRVHILTGIPGVTFEECYRHRVFLHDGQLTVLVIGLAELIRNKKATGRTIDTQDLIELEKSRKRQRYLRKGVE